MTERRLQFPSMGDDPGGSSDLFIQDEGTGEYTPFIPSESDFDDYEWDHDLEDDRGKDDDTLGGELDAYNKVQELLGGGDSFHYFPDDAMEENNKKFSLSRLQKEWGGETKRKIGYTNFFYKNFLPEELQREAEATGLASHYLLVQEFYKAAKHAEKLASQQMRGESETRTMKFKGMNRIMAQKLEERAKDLACQAYARAKDAIIKRHGGIHNGG
jgi:hypothetical protein